MEELVLCGRAFESYMASPLTKIIALRYYDGATSGFAQCQGCGAAYHFDLIAWDANQDQRIFSLAETDPQVFDDVVQALAPLGKPVWPYWVPHWQFKSPGEEEMASAKLDKALKTISDPTLVISAEDVSKPIAACRAISAAARKRLPKTKGLPVPGNWTYWRDFLGIQDAK